jgi:hypothetical protein
MAAKAKKKKKSGIRKVTVSRTRHKKRPTHRRVAVTHHRPVKRRKKRGFLGATGSSATTSNLKQIAIMAVGVATGAGITHVILRPIEKHLTDKWPMLGKFIAAGEVFLGGVIALKGKNGFVKSLGVGILAGGVHGLMKQVNIYKHIPGVSGPNDQFTDLRIPISGSFNDMVAGILEDSRRDVRTETVAGTKYTATVADTLMGSEWEEVYNAPVKG